MLSDAYFLAAAAVLHLTLPVAAAVLPRAEPPTLLSPPAAHERSEIDIDVSSAHALHPEVPNRYRTVPLEPRHYAHYDPNRPTRPYDPSRPPPLSPSAEPPLDRDPDDPTTDPGLPSEYYAPPSRGELDGHSGRPPGLGGGRLWQRYPGALPDEPLQMLPAPTQTPRRTVDRQRATKILRDGVRAQDRKLGLDFPGASAIASVIRSAVRASDAPFDCTGSFAVTVNAQGRVTQVGLNGYTGGSASTWQAVQKAVKAQLAGRAFPLKSTFAKGAMVSVTVRSQVKMPGGGTGRNGATLSFDVTDVNARPTRVVSVGFSARPVE